MPLLFKKMRRDSVMFGRVRKYFWYAIGEVVLIFVGITLALAFGDMQDERRARAEEISTLQDIEQNLLANIDTMEHDQERDKLLLSRCEEAIAIVEARTPWQPEFGMVFEGCRWWGSPYYSSAAYDSLKMKGTDLITNRAVRTSVVGLFDETYKMVAGDIDREQWDFHATVAIDQWNRLFRASRTEGSIPSDYESVLDSAEFLNLMYNRTDFLNRSISFQGRSLAATRETQRLIAEEIARLSSD